SVFGGWFEFETTLGPFSYVAAEEVDPGNEKGCDPFPDGAFDGKAAVILRGDCDETLKGLNAQRAGAEFPISHSDAARADYIGWLLGGDHEFLVFIPSVLIGHTHGRGLIDLRAAHGEAVQITVDTTFQQKGNVPDVIVGFSSRGPGVGNVLKPDIAAPG